MAWQDEPPYEKAWLTQGGDLPHPLRGDYADLPPFELDVEGSKKPSAAYVKWMKEEYGRAVGVYAEREERRLAYVAMTRARSAQLLVGSWLYPGSLSPKFPARYLMEASAQLFEHTPEPSAGTIESVEDPGMWGSGTWRDMGVAPARGGGACLITPVPGVEDRVELSSPTASETFPPAPGPSRQRVAAAAAAVQAQIDAMPQDQDVYEALAQLGEDPAVRDTVALIEEYHLSRQTPSSICGRSAFPRPPCRLFFKVLMSLRVTCVGRCRLAPARSPRWARCFTRGWSASCTSRARIRPRRALRAPA